MKNTPELRETYRTRILFMLFLIGIVAIFWTFLSNFGLGESGYNFLGKTKKVTLSPGAPITQTFTAHEKNLSQIRVAFGNVHLRTGETIELSIMDENCQEALTTTALEKKPLEQGTYTVFSFPPIQDSKDKKFCFMATYLSEENRKGDKPYLAAIDESSIVFSDRTLTDTNRNKVYESQTLFLRPAYTRGTLSGDLSRLVDRLSQYKPDFFKGWPIVILFTILIVGSSVLAFRIVYTQEKE